MKAWSARWLLLGLGLSGLLGVPRADEGLGRLLTSPEERRLIAAARGQGDPASGEEPARIHFEGALRGSDGRLMVWINGRPWSPAELARSARLRLVLQEPPLRLAVLGDDGRPHLLRPGQSYDRQLGRVLEPWEHTLGRPAAQGREVPP